MRTEIYENIEEFKKIISDNTFTKHYPNLYNEGMLKTAPKGFPKDFEDIDLLKYKHYIASKNVDDSIVVSDKFIGEVRNTFKAAYPLNMFINEGINYHLGIDN